jgi:hypothetical protein
MNKEQQQIIDEVYKRYHNQTIINSKDLKDFEELDGMDLDTGEYKKVHRQYAPKGFINRCKTDNEFSQKWGLKIEERELNLDERAKLHSNTEMFYDICATHFSIQDSIEYSNYPDKIWLHEQFTKGNIPTKLITIAYNDTKLESYE